MLAAAAARGESETVNFKNADGQTEIGYLFQPAPHPAVRNLPTTTRTAPCRETRDITLQRHHAVEAAHDVGRILGGAPRGRADARQLWAGRQGVASTA
jgi:hypothetical protein